LMLQQTQAANRIAELREEPPTAEKQLRELGVAITNQTAQLKYLQEQNGLIEKRNQENQKQLAELEKYQQEHEKLVMELNQTLDEQAKLKAILDKTPKRATVPPKIVNIPNPRAAPDGISPIYVLCAH